MQGQEMKPIYRYLSTDSEGSYQSDRGTVEWCCDGGTRSPTGNNGLLHQNGSRSLRPEDQGNDPIVVLRCQA